MGETSNKAKMAEIVSSELFNVFGWKKIGSMNQNWNCVIEKHNKRTHPSDIVLRYIDPYSNKAVYINCDLKSYAKDSIQKHGISGAVSSLAFSIECMQFSDQWYNIYYQNGDDADRRGLLFVYNHDGEYDASFNKMLETIDKKNFSLRKGSKMYIMGPWDITYLKTVTNDIEVLRGRGVLPVAAECNFFYPDLVRKKVSSEANPAATIEMLLGPWQVLQYKHEAKSKVLFYYKNRGEDTDEFLYFIDYLAHYQLLQNADEIIVKFANASQTCAGNFMKAIDEYAKIQGIQGVEKRLEKIKYESVTNIVTRFSEIEIGMEN